MAEQKPTIVLRMELEERYLARLREQCPDAEYVIAADDKSWQQARQQATAVIGGGAPSAEDLAAAPNLRWIQATSAGVEAFMTPELAGSDIVLTNFSGIHATNIADHVLALIFAFARDLKTLFARQDRREWPEGGGELTTFEPSGQTLGIVGLGEIGEALALKAHGLGMRVWALQRHPFNPPPSIDRVLTGSDALNEMLGESDHVVLCLPLTDSTKHIIGREELAQMKPGAYLYNIGRGGLIDQKALIEALRKGTLAGAGLDVTDPEPLPADAPLWDAPNVLITGHNAAATPKLWERGIELVIDNVRRFLGDEELRNVVNTKAGY